MPRSRRTNDFSLAPLPAARQSQARLRGRAPAAAPPVSSRPRVHRAAAPPKSATDQPGHWEADLMLFAKYGQAVLALARALLPSPAVAKPPGKRRPTPSRCFASHWLTAIIRSARSITFDNGTEFARHPPAQPHRHPNLLLRSPRPLAKRRHRKRHRTNAPLPAPQHRSRNHPRPRTSMPASPPTTTPPKMSWLQNPGRGTSVHNLLHFKCESTSPLSPG